MPLENIDGPSHRLLPLLYHRFAEMRRHFPDFERIKGVARYFWVRHQRQMSWLAEIQSRFRSAGIPTLLLKGPALNLTVYPPGARPMTDVDIVVPRPQAPRALELLREAGWRSSTVDPEGLVRVGHACQFQNGPGRLVDLHWDFFHGRILTRREQRRFWEMAEPVDAAGVPTRVLSPAHQLLHTCAHGARWSPAPPLRWLADAARIIQAFSDRLDWDELIGCARRHELSLYVWATLSFLADYLEVEIPKFVLSGLRWSRVPWTARVEHFWATRQAPGANAFWSSLPGHLLGYWRLRRRCGLTLPEFLRLQHQYDEPLATHWPSLWAMQKAGLAEATRNVTRRLWRRCRGQAAEVVLTMGDNERWRLKNFHELEVAGGRLFRWSDAEAALLFPELPPAPCRVALTILPMRRWPDDLEEHLEVSFDGRPIRREDIAFSQGAIRFPIDASSRPGGAAHQLVLRCRPKVTANGDTRRLGIPLVEARITPAATETHGAAA